MFTVRSYQTVEYAARNTNTKVYSSQFGMKSTALLSVIRLNHGVYHYQLYDRSVNVDGYVEFLHSLKAKHGKERFAIYLDNLRVHKSIRALETCKELGIELIWSPIYSPDLNPIEHLHAILKHNIKKERLSDMLA